MKPPRQTRSVLVDEILAYWAGHPKAEGTLESIAEWWILEERIREKVGDVERALEGLVRKGVVSRRRQADGRVFYRLK